MKTFFRQLIKRLFKHDIVSYSAQCAYYLLLGLFPFIILLFMLVSTLGIEHINDLNKLLTILPEGTITMVKDYLEYSKGISTSIFSPLLITAILISSSAITSLIKAFNIADDVVDDRNYFHTKFIAIMFIIFIVVIFTISLAISTVGLDILNKIYYKLNIPLMEDLIFNIISFTLNFTLYTLIVSSIYYILPYRKSKKRSVLPGTLFAAPTLALTTHAFGYFVNNFTKYSVVYGSMTSVVILLIWLFTCGYILIVGEEINAIIRNMKNK